MEEFKVITSFAPFVHSSIIQFISYYYAHFSDSKQILLLSFFCCFISLLRRNLIVYKITNGWKIVDKSPKMDDNSFARKRRTKNYMKYKI